MTPSPPEPPEGPRVIHQEVQARVVVEGFHRWPSPTPGREYLGHRHRHLFHVTAHVLVAHGNREIEVHDLQGQIRQALLSFDQAPPSEPYDFGTRSCEHIAQAVAFHLHDHHTDRIITVTVLEDGEAGATVSVMSVTP